MPICAREVQSLIASHEEAGSQFLVEAAPQVLQLATPRVGAKLGSYEIIELLGAGGMGEVYRAKDTRLERTVAIKILPFALSANTTGCAALNGKRARHPPLITLISLPSTNSDRPVRAAT